MPVMVLVAVIALVATACGGGKSNDNSSGSSGNQSSDSGKPVACGNLVIGIDAEEPGLLEPYNTWDNDGLTYGHLFYDTIAALGDDGKYHPFLAESIDHNPDYTKWRLSLSN